MGAEVTQCQGCGALLQKGRYCKNCSSAAARKARSRRRARLLERDGFICAYCACQLTLASMTLDHFVPRALGGGDEDENLMSSCITCNVLKGTTHPDDLDPLFHVTRPKTIA